MARIRQERMSSVDLAWLRMDRPNNLMMICGVLILAEPVRATRVRRTLRHRFLSFPRFNQRPVQRTDGAVWEGSRSCDLAYHLQTLRLPSPGGKEELQAAASSLMSTPLDSSRPLWQFHLVERYEGGSAIVMRIHHCYADGIALIQVMLSMTDKQREPVARRTSSQGRRHSTLAHDDSDEKPPGDSLFAALAYAKAAGARLWQKAAGLWDQPAQMVELAEQGAALTGEVAKLALMGQDTPTRFKGVPGIQKRVAWAEPLSLSEVKIIGRALGCSVNDVLLSSVAGALRGYLAARGDTVDGVVMRALVPVNMRPPEVDHRLGNRFGLVFLDLPIGIANPIERLYAVRANMQALKGSYQPMLAFGLIAAMGAGPKVLQDQMLTLLSRNATAVMTNVPGPQQALYFAGSELTSLLFWVPQSGDIGVGVSILSYNGRVQFGLVTDRGLCPDPERVISRFGAEFEQLVLATLLAPWPWAQPPSAQQIEEAAFPG